MTDGQPRRLPRLLLVTGMSGAGKSTVLDALEDIGWDVVDNLPVAFSNGFVHGGGARARGPVAVGMDAAAAASTPRALPADPFDRRSVIAGDPSISTAPVPS